MKKIILAILLFCIPFVISAQDSLELILRKDLYQPSFEQLLPRNDKYIINEDTSRWLWYQDVSYPFTTPYTDFWEGMHTSTPYHSRKCFLEYFENQPKKAVLALKMNATGINTFYNTHLIVVRKWQDKYIVIKTYLRYNRIMIKSYGTLSEKQFNKGLKKVRDFHEKAIELKDTSQYHHEIAYQQCLLEGGGECKNIGIDGIIINNIDNQHTHLLSPKGHLPPFEIDELYLAQYASIIYDNLFVYNSYEWESHVFNSQEKLTFEEELLKIGEWSKDIAFDSSYTYNEKMLITALDQEYYIQNKDIYKYLLQQEDINPNIKTPPNSYGYYDDYLLHKVIRKGNWEIVKILLDKGATLATEEDNETAVNWAIQEMQPEILKELVKYKGGLSPKEVKQAMLTFYEASLPSRSDASVILKFLLDLGGSPNFSKKGYSHCDEISKSRKVSMLCRKTMNTSDKVIKILRLLESYGARVKTDKQAIKCGLASKDTEVLKFYYERVPLIRKSKQLDILMRMVKVDSLAMVQWLINQGIDFKYINKPNYYEENQTQMPFLEETPLSYAILRGNYEMVKYLLEVDDALDIHVPHKYIDFIYAYKNMLAMTYDDDTSTFYSPLSLAVLECEGKYQKEMIQLVDLLLSHGADINQVVKEKTVLDYAYERLAQEKYKQDLIHFIRKKGGKRASELE